MNDMIVDKVVFGNQEFQVVVFEQFLQDDIDVSRRVIDTKVFDSEGFRVGFRRVVHFQDNWNESFDTSEDILQDDVGGIFSVI